MGQIKPCRKMFTDTLLELAKKDKQIVALTSDAKGSVTLGAYAETLPSQFVECGIAEQNEVGIAAGMAASGKKPFVCAPACFLSARSLEQVKVDVAYSESNVKIIGVSGGVSYGALGMSHHSLHDIAVMRALPNISVVLPCDQWQMLALTRVLAVYEGPVYVRMGRAAVPDVYTETNAPFEFGKANMLKDGKDATLIATGEMVWHALKAAEILSDEGVMVRVLDMHTLKPLDTVAILKAARETDIIVTVEEHSINGGLGAAVAQVVGENHPIPVKTFAIPDEPTVTGESKDVLKHYGLNATGISKSVRAFINKWK